MFIRIVPVAALFLAAGVFIASAEDDAAFSLADLAWMEGHWVMEDEGGRAEEIWTAPLDGSITGSFRWAIPGQMHVLEFTVIEEKDGEIAFRFKHFNKDYRTWEKDAPNTYRLVEIDGKRAVFENVAWNGRVPQRMTYTSLEADRLTFLGESPDAEDSEPLVLEFVRKK